ncbi:MAG TPA: gluconokinase [Pyrinomonadaceae bacterium]|nr:gluconokinase [Pyrinomonadaceae bacterium]
MSTVIDEVALEDSLEIDPSLLAAFLRTERESPVVLALDIGTSGMRAALFDGRGDEIEGSLTALRNVSHYELGAGGDANADALVEFVAQAIDVAVARAEAFVSRIDYVATSCFWHSLVGVDRAGSAVTPLLGWADTRAADAVGELRSRFDEGKVHQRTGARFHPSYWPAKLLWLRSNRGELFRTVNRWLSFSDYLFLQLFADATTSVSMASATGLFDQKMCAWDRELMEALGLAAEQLPPIASSGQTLRQLREEYALRWPLLDRAAWLPAIGDGAANNIGAGCVDSTRASLMIGTSGAMRVLFAGSPPKSLPPELFCYRADSERVVVGGALSDGGGLHAWMKDTLFFSCDDDEMETSLALMEPDAHGLTVLPFWSGERATGWSASARGTIIGLTARTKPIEILRAAMEAVCYRFALLARALDTIAPNADVGASGNALLASRAWTQMLADVLGRRIGLSLTREASCRGAALLALETIGKIDGIDTVQSESGEVFEPDLTRHDVYARAIERQQELYEKLIE